MNKSLSNYEYSVLDIETTGLSPYKGAKIVEIAAVKIEPPLKLNPDNLFNTLINPCVSIPYGAYKVHKISNQMVANAPTIEKVLPEFVSFTKNTVIVAHNAKFDMGFIQHFCENYGICLSHIQIIDTLKISKKIIPNLKSYKLDTLIEHFEIDLQLDASYRHRALFDAMHTAVLLQKLFEKIYFFNPKITLDDLVNL